MSEHVSKQHVSDCMSDLCPNVQRMSNTCLTRRAQKSYFSSPFLVRYLTESVRFKLGSWHRWVPVAKGKYLREHSKADFWQAGFWHDQNHKTRNGQTTKQTRTTNMKRLILWDVAVGSKADFDLSDFGLNFTACTKNNWRARVKTCLTHA